MKVQALYLRTVAVVIGVTALAFGGLAMADPPSRVARLGYLSGAVSFSPRANVLRTLASMLMPTASAPW